MPAAILKAVPRGMAVAVAIAFVLLNGLGIWQLERLKWKEGLIADMARTQALTPVPAADALSQVKPEWRSVRLPFCHLDAKNFIYMHSEVAGEPGYRVLTACPIGANAPAMLVDLGFTTTKVSALDFMGFTPVGRLRPYEKANGFTPVNRIAQNDWYWRSATEMGQALNTPLRTDYFLVLDLQASKANITGLTQGPLTAPLPNRHFEYALTWFGLGCALLGVFGSVVYQRYRKTP